MAEKVVAGNVKIKNKKTIILYAVVNPCYVQESTGDERAGATIAAFLIQL
jgi:hypothetical protein